MVHPHLLLVLALLAHLHRLSPPPPPPLASPLAAAYLIMERHGILRWRQTAALRLVRLWLSGESKVRPRHWYECCPNENYSVKMKPKLPRLPPPPPYTTHTCTQIHTQHTRTQIHTYTHTHARARAHTHSHMLTIAYTVASVSVTGLVAVMIATDSLQL